MSTSNGWKVEHEEDNSYTIECLDFTSREKSVTLKTADKNMTGDVNIAISAKEGSIALSGITITPTASLTYSSNKVDITGSGSVSTTFEKGWIEGQPDAASVIVSGTYTIDVNTSSTFAPKSTSEDYSPGDKKYFKTVTVSGVDLTKISPYWYVSHKTSSSNYKVFSIVARTDICICGDDDTFIGVRDGNQFVPTSSASTKTINNQTYYGMSGLNGGDLLLCKVYGDGSSKSQTCSKNNTNYYYEFYISIIRPNKEKTINIGSYYTNNHEDMINIGYDESGAGGSDEHVTVISLNPSYKDTW